ncbi:DMT family transporter [Heyndrickxia acidicola]|uniref:EamA family transporter n=1 Tax=Heyndrickxia acidicola TaxID=209389 RepID=A0ABU6MLX2_9BACI|nr:EamA family transporter [Heyndrickxia acidicola]MED1205494.1 EamA family transporter [Heyndrickxia acidicola]
MVLFNYVLMCLIFGTTFLAIKVGVDAGAPPFFSAGLRFFLAGSILFLWMVRQRKARFSLLLRREMVLTAAGLTFGTFAILYWSEQYLSSGIAAILSATGPLITLLLQAAISRKRLSVTSIAGCITGMAGVILLLLPGLMIKVSRLWVFGCIAIMLSQFFYSAGAVYSKRVVQRFQNTSPIALNAAQMIYGGAMLFVLSLFTEHVHISSMLTLKALFSLIYLIVIGSMVAHTIFYWLVAKTNPVFPSTWLYISPLIALLLGAILNKEPLSFLSFIGGFTIIIGIVLVNKDYFRQMAGKKRIQIVSREKPSPPV